MAQEHWEQSNGYLTEARKWVRKANSLANDDDAANLTPTRRELVNMYANLAQANIAVSITLRQQGF